MRESCLLNPYFDFYINFGNRQLDMNILLLGGTGAMGEYLTHILANKGCRVTCTTRKVRENVNDIIYVQGNAHDNDFLNSLLEKYFDVVVDFMVYNTDEFRKRYMKLLDSCRQYVYLSSSRVYADFAVITEESPRLLDSCHRKEYLDTDEYALTKARQENLLKESGRNNYTIIRPYITYSEIRLQLGVMEKEEWLWRALKGRTIVFSRDIADKYTTLTYGYNVAEGIVSIIGKQEALGEAFHITSNKSYKWSELLDIYLEVLEQELGYRPKLLFTDECLNLHNVNAQWQVRVDRHFNRIFDNRKIGKFINVDDFLPAKEGLAFCLRKFIKNPTFNGLNLRREALRDR